MTQNFRANRKQFCSSASSLKSTVIRRLHRGIFLQSLFFLLLLLFVLFSFLTRITQKTLTLDCNMMSSPCTSVWSAAAVSRFFSWYSNSEIWKCFHEAEKSWTWSYWPFPLFFLFFFFLLKKQQQQNKSQQLLQYSIKTKQVTNHHQ